MLAAKPEDFFAQSKACTIYRFHQEFASNIFQSIGSLMALLVSVEITQSLPFASCMAPLREQRRMPDYKCMHEYLCIRIDCVQEAPLVTSRRENHIWTASKRRAGLLFLMPRTSANTTPPRQPPPTATSSIHLGEVRRESGV
jgi:hypothetical protein